MGLELFVKDKVRFSYLQAEFQGNESEIILGTADAGAELVHG